MTVEENATASHRVALLVEYDGTAFSGLQRQASDPSIQEAFENAARALGAPECDFQAAGRTDAGVHARGQVITLRLPATFAEKNVIGALNWHLPESIRARRAVRAPEDFDPRRDAIKRTYRYLLCAGQTFPPLMVNRMGRVRAKLDLALMREAAAILQGKHDFKEWRSSDCQGERTELTLLVADVRHWRDAAAHGCDDQCFELEFTCRSFLKRMVRYLVGGICRVGGGALRPATLKKHLAEGTLPPQVSPVDACGLSLEKVEYPPEKDPFA